MISKTSPPEQKARPAPVITTALTASSILQRRHQIAELGINFEGDGIEDIRPVKRNCGHTLMNIV